jgi:hypothetical protein
MTYSVSRYVLSLRSLSHFYQTQSILAQFVILHPEMQGQCSSETCVNFSQVTQQHMLAHRNYRS